MSQNINRMVVTRPIRISPDKEYIDSKVSIVIPVLNGGVRFANLLSKIKSQKRVPNVEVIILDSGSKDDTVHVAKSFGAKVIQIPPHEFNHGSTRQVGVDNATGDLILLTVADAYPVSDYWLYKMVKCMQDNPEISVVSARQMVNKSADLYSRLTIELMYPFLNFNNDCKYFLRDPRTFSDLPFLVKRYVSFVDDVCACYRAKVFEMFSFNPVSNAEDIDIGVRLVKSGHCVGFLYTTGVFHWHSDGPDYFLKRHFNGVISFVSLFDLNIPNFINGVRLKDIALSSELLYRKFELAFRQWEVNSRIQYMDLLNLLSLIKNRSLKYLRCQEKYMVRESALSLQNLLKKLSCNLYKENACKDIVGANYIETLFVNTLWNLFKYIPRDRYFLALTKWDIYDVALKALASMIGDTLGWWFMAQKRMGNHEEADAIFTLLSKGVCYKGP